MWAGAVVNWHEYASKSAVWEPTSEWTLGREGAEMWSWGLLILTDNLEIKSVLWRSELLKLTSQGWDPGWGCIQVMAVRLKEDSQKHRQTCAHLEWFKQCHWENYNKINKQVRSVEVDLPHCGPPAGAPVFIHVRLICLFISINCFMHPCLFPWINVIICVSVFESIPFHLLPAHLALCLGVARTDILYLPFLFVWISC